jgi:tripartite-type tricarboxylate transporter receptor subunit TctC
MRSWFRHFGFKAAAAACVAVALLSPAASRADELPNLITVVCGYPPGSGADITVRFFAEKLKEMSGKTVIVENRPGALTTIAAAKVSQSKPDGSTVFITAGTFSSAPPLFKKLPFNPAKDFTPVTTIAKVAFVVAVGSKSPIKNIAELIAYLKSKGDTASFGYSSPFSLGATELFKSMAGLTPRAVAYQNSQDLQRELLSGYLDFVIQDASFTLGQISAGALRGVAVTTEQRSALLPDLPSLAEAGLKGYDLPAWWGVWLPPGATPELVARFQTMFNAMLTRDDTKAFMAKLGLEPFPGSSGELAKFQAAQIERWTMITKLAKIIPQ